MPFRDRQEAAERLAEALSKYRGQNPLVLGIPRGGVVMGGIIAKALEGDLDVVLVHKLGAPENPEVAIGSIDEEGHVCLNEHARGGGVRRKYLEQEQKTQWEQLQQRRRLYTPVRPPVDPAGRVVIVVDDGLATGSTMMGALESLKTRGAARTVAAAAVAPADTLDRVRPLADEVVCLESPHLFFAVGQFFSDFSQVEDDEVIAILQQGTCA